MCSGDSRDSGDRELSCCASAGLADREPAAAATRSAPPDAGPRWPRERAAGSPGRGALARSAASSSSACGRETSLARIAALSVTFMPGMRSVSHSGPATTGRVLGRYMPESLPVAGVTGAAGPTRNGSHGRRRPARNGESRQGWAPEERRRARRGAAGPEGRGPKGWGREEGGGPGRGRRARKAGGPTRGGGPEGRRLRR